jgi:hypothetical protein
LPRIVIRQKEGVRISDIKSFRYNRCRQEGMHVIKDMN